LTGESNYHYMKIGICNDHAGVEYKFKLVKMLKARGIEVVNYGTDTEASVDYPDYAHRLAQAVESHEVDLGIALCGTGNGMAITLNKHQGIRAGLAWGLPSAILWPSTTTPTSLYFRHDSSATASHPLSSANGLTPPSRAAVTRLA